MKHFLNKKGAVTPAVAIILCAVCIFNLVLTDFAIYRAGKYQFKRRTDMAFGSIMASFDSLLADYYGIYGVNLLHYTDYENDFRRYAMVYREKGCVQLFDWELKDYEISFSDSLAEPDALKKQIAAAMKYQTAAYALDYLIKYLTDIDDAQNMGETAKLLAEGNSLLSKAGGTISELKLCLEGAFPGDRACANGYKYAVTDFSTIATVIKDFDIYSFEKTDICDTLYIEHMHLKDMIGEFLNYNLSAQTAVLSLQQIRQEIDSFIKKAESRLKKKEEDTAAADGLKSMISDLKKQAALISNLYNYSKINGNIASLRGKMSGLYSNISEIDEFRKDYSEIPDLRMMTENVKNAFYTTDVYTSFDVSGIEKSSELQGTYTDYRFTSFKIEGLYGNDSYKIPDNIYPTVPSVVKGIKPDKTGFSVSFEDLGGLKEVFKAGSFLEGAETAGEAIINHIFVDEYVYCYCTDRLTASDNAKFKCRKEYILCGNQNASDNIKATSNKLLMLRFVLDFASLLANEEKVALSKEIGLSIACAVSAGVGADLYAILVMAAWAMTESVSDVELLVNGGRVPLIRKEGDNDKKGLGYTEYLMMLIMLEPVDTVLLRIADVIETDMSDITGERYKLTGVFTKISGKCIYDPRFMSAVLFGKKKGEISLEFKGEETI